MKSSEGFQGPSMDVCGKNTSAWVGWDCLSEQLSGFAQLLNRI